MFPEISRPAEYVAFINLIVPTLEGPGYVFLACDGFTEFGIDICIERDESPESVLKAVYLLTENEDFKRHMDKGFTLVFDRYDELAERIEAVVKPVKGKILFNKEFHKKIAAPLLSSLKKTFF